MWQISGGNTKPERIIPDMDRYMADGFTTWDLADHYGPAEFLIGAYRQSLTAAGRAEDLSRMRAFTKWVPQPGPMPKEVVDEAVERSLDRMKSDRLDLLQLHWWEYGDHRYLQALEHLAVLKQEGKIWHLGLTNFDSQRLEEICAAGIPIVSNQVQYSLIDRRAAVRMAEICQTRGVGLLTYGTLCGGLISDSYLRAREPFGTNLDTVSLRKYKPMIDAWGGWHLFQELLEALRLVADRYDVNIANVAVRYVLDQPAVAGVIVGARLGMFEHRKDNARVFALSLDGADIESIDQVLCRSNDLYKAIGDCGDEYRR